MEDAGNKSLQDRLQRLGLGAELTADFLFEWKQRSEALIFLAEKLLNGKTVPETCQMLKAEVHVGVAQASMLSTIFNFLGIPATSQDILGDGDEESRALFMERILGVAENLQPWVGSAHCDAETKRQSIDDIRQGMTSNIALITAAVRSRKGCLAPKVDFLPQTVVTEAEEPRESTLQDVMNSLSEISMLLEAQNQGSTRTFQPVKSKDQHGEFIKTLETASSSMEKLRAQLSHCFKDFEVPIGFIATSFAHQPWTWPIKPPEQSCTRLRIALTAWTNPIAEYYPPAA